MSIDTKKSSMGWVSAKKRQDCHNFKHGDESISERSPPFETKSWVCKLGGFKTGAGAVCIKHEPK